eukprot:1138162-Pelagomonas_calceolata.AAC.4
MFGVPKGVGLGALQEAEAELCRAQEYLLDWKERVCALRGGWGNASAVAAVVGGGGIAGGGGEGCARGVKWGADGAACNVGLAWAAVVAAAAAAACGGGLGCASASGGGAAAGAEGFSICWAGRACKEG